MIVWILAELVVVAVIVFGGVYLYLQLSARRDARRMLGISERAADGDAEGAKALVAGWERRTDRAIPLRRLRVVQGWQDAGDHERALALLENIELPKGRSGRSLRWMAWESKFEALKALGQAERAQAVLEEAINEDPAAPWLLIAAPMDPRLTPRTRSVYARGKPIRDAFMDHRFGEAADMMEALIPRAARNPMARVALPLGYLFLGSAQLAAGRDSVAEASFRAFVERSLDRDAAERRVMEARAGALLSGGRYSEAASVYEALVDETGMPSAYSGLAMCRVRLGEADAAARDLDRAEELGFDRDRARFVRAQILVDQRRSAEAVTLAYEAAGTRPPSDPEAAYTLAYVLATAQHPDAEATLRSYVAMQPDDPDLSPLLDRSAPNGSTWREYLESRRREEG